MYDPLSETTLTESLQSIRRQLTQPFFQTRQTLLVLTNGIYLLLMPAFIGSEKMASGHFVPHPILGWMYGLVAVTNLISFVYNLGCLRGWFTARTSDRLPTRRGPTERAGRLERVSRWGSLLSIMGMSFCHMLGMGNPSSDAILTAFALGHSLIVLAAIMLGRPAAFVWFLLVLGVLIHGTFIQKGYDYQYNYLTPTESAHYQAALRQGQGWGKAGPSTGRPGSRRFR